PEFPHFAEALPDLVLGIGQRLEELGVRAVPGTVPPVLLAARLITGFPACRVEFPYGGAQADDGARVDARALRAREHLTDGLGQFPGLVEHLRTRVQPFLFTAHDRVLSSRSAACGGDGCASRANRSAPPAKQGRERMANDSANEWANECI